MLADCGAQGECEYGRDIWHRALLLPWPVMSNRLPGPHIFDDLKRACIKICSDIMHRVWQVRQSGPTGLKGGLNPYHYPLNPVTDIDSLGLFTCEICRMIDETNNSSILI